MDDEHVDDYDEHVDDYAEHGDQIDIEMDFNLNINKPQVCHTADVWNNV